MTTHDPAGRRLTLALSALLALATLGAPATADETLLCNRYILSLPYTINVPGHYCLASNLSTSANPAYTSAITINADSVLLDLNQYTLDGSAAGSATTLKGVFSIDRSSITVRNGVVRGFWVGIDLANPSGNARGHTVEHIWADRNTRTGIETRGTASLVRNNVVTDTGGSTNLLNPGGAAHAFGIDVGGPASVIDNQVTHVFGLNGGNAWGLIFTDQGVIAVNNRVVGPDTGGFACVSNSNTAPQAVLRDNIVLDTPQPYFTACTTIGTTNFP